VLGVSLDHGFCDVQSAVVFMQNWSLLHRGEAIKVTPHHERCVFDDMPPSSMKPTSFFCTAAGHKPEKIIKNFGADKVQGNPPVVLAASISRASLASLKSEANKGLLDGVFVSTDDAITAHVWRALCRMRCSQLGIANESQLTTSLARACNFRSRMRPPLLDGYCGNAVTELMSQLTVQELQTFHFPRWRLVYARTCQRQRMNIVFRKHIGSRRSIVRVASSDMTTLETPTTLLFTSHLGGLISVQ